MSKSVSCLLMGLAALIQVGAAFGADPSLIGYWPMDEGTGTVAYDVSGNGNNGTLSRTATGTLPTWVGGKFGSSVQLNGSNNWIDCGNAPIFDLTSQVTLAAWVYPARAAATGHECYITKGDLTYTLKEASTSGNVEMNIYNAGWHTATLTGRTAADNNTWYHLAGTFDGSNIKLYLNGAVAATTAWSGTIATSTTNVCIGRDGAPSAGQRYYSGRIDDVRIYNRALTETEVAGLLINARASSPTPSSGATDVDRDGIVLSWTAGDGAVKHNVYLGTDKANLPQVSGGQEATTWPLGRLPFNTTYYWRVDEVAASGAVTEGYLWSFTVEPETYVITAANITATASAYLAGSDPNKTKDGSGLTGDLHDAMSGSMWVSGPTTQPVWIQYSFDRVYKMNQMLVWNYNSEYEMLLGFGVMNATVQYSSDGVNFTNLGDYVFNQGDSAEGYKYNTTADFQGAPVKAVKILAGSNYGGAQYGLSEVRFLYTRGWATVPYPTDAATGVVPNVTLTWRSGRDVASHNVYLGTDPNALTVVATTPTPGYAPTSLVLGTKYYWKIDEVNGTGTWTSATWSFTVAPYVIVEDMESYNATTNKVYDTWLDGYNTTTNGSVVGVADAGTTGTFNSTTISHAGRQSMPLAYGTNSITNSETTRTFASAQNWTLYGAKVLTVFFYGQAANITTVPLWVKLTDSADKNAKVTYGSGTGEEAVVLADIAWTTWNLPLSSFTGVDATKIKSITIGLGTGAGAGTLYIDDIRLYPPVTATTIAPTLVGWWKLDNDYKDSSGNANNGTASGGPTFVTAGKIGASLKLDGTDDYVDCGAAASLDIIDQVSLSAWIKPANIANSAFQTFVAKGDYAYAIHQTTGNVIQFFIYDGAWYSASSAVVASTMNNSWHHVAGSYDGTQLRVYVDGVMAGSTLRTGVIATSTTPVNLGRNATYSTRFYPGEIDEARVYRGVLPTSEIKKLANP